MANRWNQKKANGGTNEQLLSAAAIVPVEEKWIESSNGIFKRRVNSFFGHCSVSYNLRYTIITLATWDAYKFFSTVALCVYLLQGPPEQVLLGMVIIPLEAVPQFLSKL